MKNKIKGLISLWLVFAMLCISVLSVAAEAVNVRVFTGDYDIADALELSDIDVASDLEFREYEFGTPLDEAIDFETPEGSVHKGWRIWSTESGDALYQYTEPYDVLVKDASINEWYANQVLEPVFCDHAIVTEPTLDDPTVELNRDEGASYQWYREEFIPVMYNKANNESKYFYESAKMYYYVGEELGDGVWTSAAGEDCPDANIIDFYIDGLEKDWVLKITPLEGENVTAVDYNLHFQIEDETNTLTFTEDDGVYSATVPEDGLYYVYVYGDTEFEVLIEVVVSDTVQPEELVGETGNTLGADMEAHYRYWCEVSWDDGCADVSASLVPEVGDDGSSGQGTVREITHQPTADEPYVEVNVTEGADYQWYKNSSTVTVPVTETSQEEIDGDIYT